MNTLDPSFVFGTSLAVLRGIDQVFEQAVEVVRNQANAGNEKLSIALDRFQIQTYELASISAELHAARCIVAYANKLGAIEEDLETRLAGAFVADIIVKLRGRFEKIRRVVGVSENDLKQAFSTSQVESYLEYFLDPTVLEKTGEMVVESLSNGRSLLDDEQQMIAASFARLANDVVAPLAEQIHREDQTVPDEIIQALADMGCFALSVPESYGGSAPESGHDNLSMCVVTEELSRASLAAAGSPLTRPEIATRAIMAGDYEPQKAKWLPGIAKGDPIVAIAVTEPDCGSDVAAVRLRATRVPGGWQLNGAKTWCTFAGKAGLLIVLARTDPDLSKAHRGLSLFLVEKQPTDSKSFEQRQDGGGKLTGHAIPTIGYRGMHSYTLFFDDFFVPEEHLVGGPEAEGRGFYLTMQGFAGGRLQTAARACGVMRAAFEAALSYTEERKVFGNTLNHYPLTRAKLVAMAANLRACQEMTYEVASLMDAGGGQMEASLVKLYACRAAEFITREAMQLHGGMGYSEETPVSRYFVDARVLSIFEGAEETLALKVVARELIGAGT